MSHSALSPPPTFSDAGAQDNGVVVKEAREWIEEVTGKKFGSSFRESLKDGVLFCELMKKINPGSISKINKLKSPIAHLDNIQMFLSACRELGMKDSQLFDMMDLQSPQITPKKSGVKRDDADRKIRSVCVTLYWLGRIVAEMEDYKGPQLDLSAFSNIMEESQYSDDSNESPMPTVEPPDHYQLEIGNHVSSPEMPTTGTVENGMGLTFEQEQTADQLLADIQSAVDEMLQDFQSGYIPEETPDRIKATRDGPKRVGVSVHMISRNGGFGFQVVGGADANYHPEVELILPGSAAEDAGIQTGDQIVSVNKEDVSSLTHFELVSLIKKAGSEGSMLIGLIRESREEPPANTTIEDTEEQLSIHSEDLEGDDDEEEEEEIEDSSTSRAIPLPITITSYGAPPLPTLVEYQEESMLEQITEMIEKSPPPPDSPLPTPTHSSPVPTSPLAHGQVSDDRESIERDLQEIVQMEMEAAEKKHNLEGGDSVNEEIDDLQEEIEGLLSVGRASKSPQPEEKFESAFALSSSFIESPPPPKPTTEAPKRQIKLPPPIKVKPKRPLSFVQATALPPKDDEPERAKSATPTKPTPPPVTTPPTCSSPVVSSATPTKPRFTPPPPPVTPPPTCLSPVVSSATPTKPRFTPPPPPVTPPPTCSSPVVSVQPMSEVIATDDTPTPEPMQAVPTTITAPTTQTSHSPIDRPSSQTSPSPVATPSSQPSHSPINVDISTVQVSGNPPSSQSSQATVVKSTPQRPETLIDSTSQPTTTVQVAPTAFTTQATPTPQATISTQAMPDTQATPTTTTSQPLQVKEVGLVSPDDIEIVGNVKIHRVQRTRWTPKGSSTESVTYPEDQNKQRYQQHFTQKWAKDANRQTPTSATTPTRAHKKFPEPYETPTRAPMRVSPRTTQSGHPRRHTQPVGMANWQTPLGQDDRRGLSGSNKVLSQPQQPKPRTNWKSQEELRINRNLPTPTGPPTTDQRSKTTPRQQSMPTQQYNTQSLPRGNTENWRVGRHNTWSRGSSQARDGQQSAFALKPKNPYDLCSRCHKHLGTETIMSIPNLKVQYHMPCFVCRVCRIPLVRSAHNTTVLIKGMHPHCKHCGSNDQGEPCTLYCPLISSN